mgnify:FL=1
MSSLPAKVAGRIVGRQAHLAEAAEIEIKKMLMRKCVQPADEGGLDLVRIADGTKLSTWAYRLITSSRFAATVLRNINADRNRHGAITFSPVRDYDPSIFDVGMIETITAEVERSNGADADKVRDVIFYAKKKAKRLSRIHIGARHVAAEAGVTIPVAAVTAADRKRIVEELTSSASTAADAVEYAYRQAGRKSAGVPSAPTLVKVLAQQYTAAELKELTHIPHASAYILGMALSTPRPSISHEVKTELMSAVKDLSPKVGWRTLAGRLVHAFHVAITDLPSESSPNFATAKPRSTSAAAVDQARLGEVADEVAAFPGMPMGASRQRVEAALSEMLAAAETRVIERFAQVSVPA